MADPFFDHPILNSPYEYPKRHWELDDRGQPTQQIIDSRHEVISDVAYGIACWFIGTDYNEEGFFVRQSYFLGVNDPCNTLKTTLKAEIDLEARATLNSDIFPPFDKPKSECIAVNVINHLGDEVWKVFRV
jgi:adenine-specific DNA-methyltransferase